MKVSASAPPAPALARGRSDAQVRAVDRRAALARVLVSPWLIAALLVVGLLLRIARYVADLALWLDEAYLALNLMNRSYSELLGTLDFGQGAPPGFLLAQKFVVNVLGDGELALRLLPLVAGVAALFLFYLVAREILAPAAAALALLLFAVGEPFVAYSAELKQYGFDVAVGLALLYVFLQVVSRPIFTLRHALVVAAAGAAAVWLSHASVFVLAGVGAGLAFALFRRGDRRGLVALAVPAALWLVSFFAMYALTLRGIEHVEAATAEAVGGAQGVVRNVFMLFYDLRLIDWAGAGIAATLAVFGVVSLWGHRRKRPLLVGGAATLLCTVAAGYVGVYPVGHRFILFLLPFAVLCLAEGAVRLLRVLPRDLSAALGVILAATVVLPAVGTGALAAASPPQREEIKPVLAYLGERWQAGDTLYVMGSSQYALRYYLECSDCDDAVPRQLRDAIRVRPNSGHIQTTAALISETPTIVIGHQKRKLYALQIEQLQGRDRVWMLLTHRFRTRTAHLEPFERFGVERECSPEYGGAFVCLYDLARRPQDVSPAARNRP